MLYDKRWEQKSIELEPWQRVLLDAADIIETHGWCQGSLYRDGSHCAVGAMSTAATVAAPRSWQEYRDRAWRKLSAVVGPVGMWNDQPERTAAEVCAKLREVAGS